MDTPSSESLKWLMARLFDEAQGSFAPQETHGDGHPYHITLIGGIRQASQNVDQGVQRALEEVAAVVAPISATLGPWQVNKTGLVMVKVPQCFDAACTGLLLAAALPVQYSRNCWYHQDASSTATPNLHVTVGYFHGPDKKRFQNWLNEHFSCVGQSLVFNQIEFENDQGRPNLPARLLAASGSCAADVATTQASVNACESAKFGRWEDMKATLHAYCNTAVENVRFVDMYPRSFGLIHQAAYHGRQDIVEELVERYQADPQLRTRDGRTAAQVAREYGHSALASCLDCRCI